MCNRVIQFICVLLVALGGLYAAPVWADYTLNMPVGVTSVSREIYHLHMLIFWICCAIGVLVFSVMFYAIIFHRKSRGAVAANFHDSLVVEIIWTIIPFIILVAMAVPATKVLFKMDDVEDSELTIKVTGFMWRWQYDYLDKNISFTSDLSTPNIETQNRSPKSANYLREVDNPLVVPVGVKIRFLTTANDVIHSWWVPDLGVKKDAIPGFINETWALIDKPGVYRGQCAELCGARHAFMPIVVKALPKEEFEKWVIAQQPKEETVEEAIDEPAQELGQEPVQEQAQEPIQETNQNPETTPENSPVNNGE